MKNIGLFVVLFLFMASLQLQAQTRVIVIGAHPDDCENDAGGTAALFAKM